MRYSRSPDSRERKKKTRENCVALNSSILAVKSLRGSSHASNRAHHFVEEVDRVDKITVRRFGSDRGRSETLQKQTLRTTCVGELIPNLRGTIAFAIYIALQHFLVSYFWIERHNTTGERNHIRVPRRGTGNGLRSHRPPGRIALAKTRPLCLGEKEITNVLQDLPSAGFQQPLCSPWNRR